jgi:hypothetical protein
MATEERPIDLPFDLVESRIRLESPPPRAVE